LTLGRDFLSFNNSKSAPVAIVNEAFARRAFGSASPLGQQLFQEPKHDLLTIIGVVSDARYRTLRDDAPPTVYRPVAQLPPSFDFLLALHLEVWTSTPPLTQVSPITTLIKRANPLANLEFHSFESMIDANLLYERLLTALSVAFGAIGLLLSAIGVYGLCAYSVARRIPEFGIRMAMGATPRALVSLVLSEHLRPLFIGLLAGSLISLALTRFLRAWLFGVSATDPELFFCAMILLAALALCAAFLPARRAAHLDPVSALRFE
jgi:putative ABC transport system permease protein